MGVAAALLIGGAVLSAEGQLEQGRVAKLEADTSAAIGEVNAQQLEREAESRKDASRIEVERISKQEKIETGQAIARFGKSGVSLGTGTPIAVLADMAESFATDKALTARQGLIDSQRLGKAASIERLQAKFAKTRGKSAKKSAILGAAGTLLGAAGLAAGISGGGGTKTTNTSLKNTFEMLHQTHHQNRLVCR